MTQPVVVEEVDENLVALAVADILKDVYHGIAAVAVQLLEPPCERVLAAQVEALEGRYCQRIQNLTHLCPPLPVRVSLQFAS